MMRIQSYRDLTVWQMSMDLACEVYRLTSLFPASERYGLTAQLRRAVTSIVSNIAEGHARTHRGDYLHHLSIARGSTIEAEVQLLLAERLGYLCAADLEQARRYCDSISRMITQLKRALGARPNENSRVAPPAGR
jgi:four helix bundle protein